MSQSPKSIQNDLQWNIDFSLWFCVESDWGKQRRQMEVKGPSFNIFPNRFDEFS